MTRRALVTGVAGQDGGYLAEHLLGQRVQVHGVVRPGADGEAVPDFLQSVTLHELDLTDTAASAALVAELAPDEIYNLAAVSSVARSWEEPMLTAMVNGVATAALLEAADRLRRSGTDVRFVQASSSEIFGAAQTAPQNESTPIAPGNPYGAAKAYGHHLTGVYRARGLHASAVILYGHESVRRPRHFVTRKITATVAEIRAGRADELTLGALDVRRDWGWAPEYVEAMVLAAGHDEPGDYVLATGRDHSIADFVEAAFRYAGIEDYQRYVRSEASLHRPTDAALQKGDAGKAARELGWQPRTVFPQVVHKMLDADLAGLGVAPVE